MALSQKTWIQTDQGMAYAGDICEFFKAAIAREDTDEESAEGEEDVESTPSPTHGVWVTLVSSDSRLIYQGNETQVDTLIDKLRTDNNAVDLSYLIPSYVE